MASVVPGARLRPLSRVDSGVGLNAGGDRAGAADSTGSGLRATPLVDTYQGHRVEWTSWTTTRHLPNPARSCPRCGYQGAHGVAWGRVHPQPGDMMPEVRVRASGDTYTVDVEAWPVLRLEASRCPSGHLQVTDLYTNMAVTLNGHGTQPSLFPDLPEQRRPSRGR